MKASEVKREVAVYTEHLKQRELSKVTIEKYRRDIMVFLETQGDGELEKQDLINYRTELLKAHRTSSVNSYLISLNQFFRWLGREELTIKTLRIQRHCALENVMSGEEYLRLLESSLESGRRRDYLLLRTLAATGIRVSELYAITYEAALHGSVELECKKKFRKIYIAEALSLQLVDYCSQCGISAGVVFCGRRPGEALQPSSVWKLVKRAAARCGVEADKAYPHSLRHLFAKTYMSKVGNIFELADLLGHSSVETTRIYARPSCREAWNSVNALGL